VILNLWDTGCGPCRAEMPALAALQARFEGDLAVITLTPEFPSQVWRALDKRSLTLPPLSGYTKRYEWVPRRVIPVTLFVDRVGVIRDFAIGKQSEQEFENAFRPYL
jgi:thiol-disulfide isomerase/thioredoxin